MSAEVPVQSSPTQDLTQSGLRDRRELRVVVSAGPDRGKSLKLRAFQQKVGKGSTCDLVLTDPTVSALHLGIMFVDGRVHLRDLGSRNGSFHAGARFVTLELAQFAPILVGRTELRIEPVESAGTLPPSPSTQLGGLHACSERMRRVFTLLERAAPTDLTVLVQGETGTGKELVAQAVHQLSRRARAPFVVCDLASLAGNLAESDLFGHVRGAFTGAERERAGAFEAASGGTIFLDEIGELPTELQPRLLRVLQERQVRRVGGNDYRKVDVRVIAATNRDLAEEVRAGRFRADLYHRLSAVMVHVPPLRERPEDIAFLTERFLAEHGRADARLDAELVGSLAAYGWPGNVRELRNVLERTLALGADGLRPFELDQAPRAAAAPGATGGVDPDVPFHDAKGRLVDTWEREYLSALLGACQGNVSLAARRGGLDRAYLYKLLKKHGLAAP